MLKSWKKKVPCRFQGLKLEQEKNLVEIIIRITFLYFARNPIYTSIICGIFILHAVYFILMFPSSSWNSRNILFGLSTISMFSCFSMLGVSKNELSRFFDSSMDIRMNRASLQRTSVIVLQSVFGLALVLLSAQLHFSRHYSPYDIVLVILCIIVTTRLAVVIIVWTNCVYRFAEKLHELKNFLEKCNGRTEYEHLALKLKDVILCSDVLRKNVSSLLLLSLIMTVYCLLLVLKNILSTTIFIFFTSPFLLLYLVCSYANFKLGKLKTASLRLFDLQFITPAINSLVNYFWMAQKIERLDGIEVKYLFWTTYSNIFKLIFYFFLVYISFEHCITSVLHCKNF